LHGVFKSEKVKEKEKWSHEELFLLEGIKCKVNADASWVRVSVSVKETSGKAHEAREGTRGTKGGEGAVRGKLSTIKGMFDTGQGSFEDPSLHNEVEQGGGSLLKQGKTEERQANSVGGAR